MKKEMKKTYINPTNTVVNLYEDEDVMEVVHLRTSYGSTNVHDKTPDTDGGGAEDDEDNQFVKEESYSIWNHNW